MIAEADLFETEVAALQRARQVLASATSNVGHYQAAMHELATHYAQLVHQSRRLIARSDRTERELNRLNARLKQLSDELEHEARHDNLTGALNRGAVFESARRVLEHSALAVIVLDIDYFKHINDDFGHPTGDAVICELVDRLRAVLDGEGLVGRVGGEEFSILLPGADLEQAVTLAGRIRKAIAGKAFACLSTRPVTASFGVSWSAAHAGFEEAYARADKALYQAKRAGRNRVEFAAD